MENKSIVTCADCGKREEYDLKPGYPKKYCTECGAIRKAQYNNKSVGIASQPSEKAPEKAVVSELNSRESSIVSTMPNKMCS